MKKVNNRNFLYTNVLSIWLMLVFSVSVFAQEGDVAKGKTLFNQQCAACHKLDKRMTGPALAGIADKRDREWLQKWIRNSAALIKSGDADAIAIFEEYNKVPMTAFPQLSDQDIDDILAYTSAPPPAPEQPKEAVQVVASDTKSDVTFQIMLAGFLVVFVVLIVLLVSLNRTLKMIAEANGVNLEALQKTNKLPIWKAFVQNQFLVISSVIFLLLASSYFVYGYLMQIDVNQGYEPIQPIHYSHKIHAGDNQIDCKFCHSSARVSKTAGIPSLNVCMNCHETISEYNGEEDLANGYTKEFYTGEIKKLYKAVGWDEEKREYTGKTEPVRWVRVHNLPDFAYFNHSQHVTVAGVQCQECHGPVEEMEILHQHAPLTMGWCVECHRKTEVKMDNKYYEKIHEELSKKYGVEKLTIAQMGGLECGKCHY
ncbi:c-type cytochrome [Capnocytophaga canimorsus]|uniref:c-type cytochrome n=1 Tax=Capnocytophaga canimorsus TaxID=28188 RepID=UPI001AD45CFD|nr:c-type cytochrome [Capnocytophaga canimorsus]GIM58162.1 cytochrome c [Capnocytophaga canimorsus]